MKFFVSKDIRENRSLVTLLSGMMILTAVYVAGSFWLLSETVGLSAKTVTANLLGSEEAFTDPMDPVSLVEMVHTAFFIGPISILIVVSLLLRLSRNDRFNLWITLAVFGSFLGLYGGIFLVRFVSESWLGVYQIALFSYHGLMGALSLGILFRLWFGGGSHGR